MSGKRVFQIIVGIVVVATALLVVQPFTRASGSSFENQQALRQYQLSQQKDAADAAVAPQALRLYQLSEQKDGVAGPAVAQQGLSLYEHRYLQAAQPVISPELMHLYQMGERYGEAPATAVGVTDPVVLKELADVRQATVKYQDVNVALADGFIATPNCVSDPTLGGMGIHYINPARLMDPAVNILEPEILLYSQTADGLKLLGVEYMFAIGAPDTHVPNPAPPSPIIFGRSLDGPMEQHEPGQPPHYDLHVWIWKANPAGIFAMFNPNVSCQ
jgi:hypothetical protein